MSNSVQMIVYTCVLLRVLYICTTEALEIKGANSVCLRRIVAQSYGVWFRSVWVSPRILWYKPVTLHPLCGLVDTLKVLVGVM